MKKTLSVILIVSMTAIMLVNVIAPSQAARARLKQVTYIKFKNNPINVVQKKRMRIRYRLSRKSWVSISVIKNGRTVRSIKRKKLQKRGAYIVYWNGLNKAGRTVGMGRYTLKIVAKDYKRKKNRIYRRSISVIGRIYNKILGVVVDGSPSTALPQLEQLTSYKFGSYQRFQSSTYDFDRSLADWLYSRNMTMELCWMPRDPSNPSINQPDYQLSTIIRGDHDATIRRWANQMKAFGKLIYFRPMAEMNDAKTWGGNSNGNLPSEFIPAWRHVYNIFKQEGALNVKFVWCPNRDSSYSKAEATFKTYYPGDDYVDYTGFDGYNFGTIYPDSQWRSLDEVLKYSYTTFAKYTSKPMVISEIASTEQGGNKAAWTKDFLLKMKYSYPRIKRVYWFNINKQTDFRIQSSQDNLNSFRTYSK